MNEPGKVSFLHTISGCWPLLLGMAFIMLGNGLQASLTGIRASMEEFGTIATGLVMSGYFMGLIVGCRFTPLWVRHVGHIRIFGALASLASVAILVQAVFIDPLVWWVMRGVTGYSYAGLYIVAESWLNEASENDTRGQLFSFYMLISFGGLGGGQALLNLFSPSGYELFLLVSLLISLAVIPILVSVSAAPQYELMESVNMHMLYRIAPLGVVGMLVSGMVLGSIYGMGPVYATDVGMPVEGVSLFMAMIILGGFLFQYPLGWLSDIWGRRVVIFSCSLCGALLSLAALRLSGEEGFFYPMVVAVGGLTLPLYALCVVHTNDYLNPIQMVAASGTLVLVCSIGATIGSPLTAVLMDVLGPKSFYLSISGMLGVIALFSLWRLPGRVDVEKREKGEFIVMAATPLAASLTPDVELTEIQAASSIDEEAIQASFEKLAEESEA